MSCQLQIQKMNATMQPRCWELLGQEHYSPLLTLSCLILIFLWRDSCLLWSSRAPRHLWRLVGNLLVLTTLVSGPFLQQIIGKLLSLFQLWRQNIKNNLSSADRPSQSCASIVTVRRLCCITLQLHFLVPLSCLRIFHSFSWGCL